MISHMTLKASTATNSFHSMLLVFRVQCVDVSVRRTLYGRLAE